MVTAVAVGVGKTLTMKYLRSGMTKKTPKKAAVTMSAISFPMSS